MLNQSALEHQLCKSHKTRTLQASLTFSDHGPARGMFLGKSPEPQDAGRPTCGNTKWDTSPFTAFSFLSCESSLAKRSINSYSRVGNKMAKAHSDSKFCHVTVLLAYDNLFTIQSHPFGLFYLTPCSSSRKKKRDLARIVGP